MICVAFFFLTIFSRNCNYYSREESISTTPEDPPQVQQEQDSQFSDQMQQGQPSRGGLQTSPPAVLPPVNPNYIQVQPPPPPQPRQSQLEVAKTG